MDSESLPGKIHCEIPGMYFACIRTVPSKDDFCRVKHRIEKLNSNQRFNHLVL